METKDAAKGCTLELPTPREDPCKDHRKNCSRGYGEVIVRGCLPSTIRPPEFHQVEDQRDDDERNREVHQHDMLRMFREQGVVEIEGLHHFTTIFPVIFGCTEQ